MESLRAQIVARRLALGMTQAELARRTGIARPNVTRFENGKHVPRLDTIERMCVALSLELITRDV